MAALAFLEETLSDYVAMGMHSKPTVPGRTMLYGPTGRLSQNYTAAQPIHRFEVSHGIKTVLDFQEILDLWYIVHFEGPYSGFRALDWRDYELTQDNSRLTATATLGVFQINRAHRYRSREFLRPIYKPRAGIVVWRTRSAVLSVATATVDTTTGLATITGDTAGDTYTCEGLFDNPVTFSDDEWDAELDGSVDHFVAVTGSIKLEEILL